MHTHSPLLSGLPLCLANQYIVPYDYITFPTKHEHAIGNSSRTLCCRLSSLHARNKLPAHFKSMPGWQSALSPHLLEGTHTLRALSSHWREFTALWNTGRIPRYFDISANELHWAQTTQRNLFFRDSKPPQLSTPIPSEHWLDTEQPQLLKSLHIPGWRSILQASFASCMMNVNFCLHIPARPAQSETHSKIVQPQGK